MHTLSMKSKTIELWRTCIKFQVHELKLVTIEQEIYDFSSFLRAVMSALNFLSLLLGIFKVLFLTSVKITPDGKFSTSLSNKSKWPRWGTSLNVSEWINLNLWPRMLIVCYSLNHSLANLMVCSSFVKVFAFRTTRNLALTEQNFIIFTNYQPTRIWVNENMNRILLNVKTLFVLRLGQLGLSLKMH